MKDCKIIQDLMPNYIDNLTSTQSNEYVENHLKDCEECTNYFNEMKSKIELSKTDSIKQEIDYMKKANKKMNIGKKLLIIIGVLIVIALMIFWREAYTLMCYADICNKYLFWQEQAIEKGNYSVRQQQDNDLTYFYCTSEKQVTNKTMLENGTTNRNRLVIDANSDIEGTRIIYHDGVSVSGEEVVLKFYSDVDIVNYETHVPYSYMFDLKEKATFFELMSTIVSVRYIRIEKRGDTQYYFIELEGGDEIYINKETGLVTERSSKDASTAYYTIAVGNVTEEQLNFPSEDDYIILGDYELPDRSRNEATEKISNCEAEAGTIVSYNFKVENDETEDLTGFMKTSEQNLMLMKITNNMTYKKMQEKFKGLRDLTDEDFKQYFVVLVIDKDKNKEIAFSNYGYKGTTPYKMLTMNEKEATSDYKYSGSLVIIPNSEDIPSSGITVLNFDAEIE